MLYTILSKNHGNAFEVHVAGCAHLKRKDPQMKINSHWDSEADDIDALIEKELTELAESQGDTRETTSWSEHDYDIAPCARK